MDFIEKIIIDKIMEFSKISLFFHEIPDFDALGASYALKQYISSKFPNKTVQIIGLDILDPIFSKGYFVFNNDHISNDFLSDSLGIILDTSNEQRVWSNRHKYCKELIRIDHHPQVENFADIEWIDADAPATCELISKLLFDWDPVYVDTLVASYLYAGIITDTGRFLYAQTRDQTLALASKLLALNFDRQKLNDVIYLKSIKQATFEHYVFNRFHYEEELKFGYAIIPKNAYDKFDVDLRLSMVHVFNGLKNLEVWATFYYDDTVNRWRGSLRSRVIPINEIAKKYNGGGHELAAGFTLKNKSQIKNMLHDIRRFLINLNEQNSMLKE